MRLLVVTLLFIALGVPSYAISVETETTAAGADDAGVKFTPYIYSVGGEILLNCSSEDASPGISYIWSKNGTAIEQLEELEGRYEQLEGGAVLHIKRHARQDDYGEYVCRAEGVTKRAWRVVGRPYALLRTEVNVVEGQKLTLTCKIVGKPYPPVQWVYAPIDGETASAVPVEEVAGARVTLHDTTRGVQGGVLELEGVVRADAGIYSCVPLSNDGVRAHTIVHVEPKNNTL